MTMMVVEFGAVTPPIGMNIFVLTKQLPEVSAADAFRGIVPYLGADVARLLLFIVFPGLVLWLPNMFFN
jgi:TRAP-type C4-dicarboxylate transport system permease large subunit